MADRDSGTDWVDIVPKYAWSDSRHVLLAFEHSGDQEVAVWLSTFFTGRPMRWWPAPWMTGHDRAVIIDASMQWNAVLRMGADPHEQLQIEAKLEDFLSHITSRGASQADLLVTPSHENTFASRLADAVTRNLELRLDEYAVAASADPRTGLDAVELARQMVDSVMPAPSDWVRIVGPVLRAETVCARLNITRVELDELVAGRRLLQLVTQEGLNVYPSWQFQQHGGVVEALAPCLAEFSIESIDSWTVAAWFGTKNEFLGDMTPAQAVGVQDPHAVVQAARDAGRRFRQ